MTVKFSPDTKYDTGKPSVFLENGQTVTQFGDSHSLHELVDEIRKLGAKEVIYRQKCDEFKKENTELKERLNELEKWESNFSDKMVQYCDKRNLEFKFEQNMPKMFRTKTGRGRWHSFEEIEDYRNKIKENPDFMRVPTRQRL